jgi:hypothetical protein
MGHVAHLHIYIIIGYTKENWTCGIYFLNDKSKVEFSSNVSASPSEPVIGLRGNEGHLQPKGSHEFRLMSVDLQI